MINNVMVDLETLDNKPTSLILSIGAVRFDLDNGDLRDGLYLLINPVSAQNWGLTVGVDTVLWWMKQSQEARDALLQPGERFGLHEALKKFSEFVNRVEDTFLWGNGSTFDNMILRNAFSVCELDYPVSYRHDLCYRTMRRMFPHSTPENFEGVRHNALDDARHQALNLIHIMRRLKETK